MIGDGSLNITKGTATVAFTQAGTSVSIPADCEAEIAGPFMDADAYRLPKNDSMSVAGKLTVKKDSSSNAFSGMEVAGKLDVTEQGIVAVESGKLELVKTVSGQNQGKLRALTKTLLSRSRPGLLWTSKTVRSLPAARFTRKRARPSPLPTSRRRM